MLGALHPSRFFGDAFQEIDATVEEGRLQCGGSAGARQRALFGLALAATMLTILEYFSGQGTYRELCSALVQTPGVCDGGQFGHLYGFVWWSGSHVLCYFVLPALVARRVFGMSWSEQGLSWAGTGKKLRLYGALLLLVLPVILGASFQADFISYYPFYKQASRSWWDLLCWEALYLAQFFALEYFFRGFLLNVCRPSMGASAIFAMIVPYCMIHFGKPALEAFAAIFAGLVLGTLAMRTRSIWGGVGVHAGVALTMDVAALLQGLGLPQRWWPP